MELQPIRVSESDFFAGYNRYSENTWEQSLLNKNPVLAFFPVIGIVLLLG